MNLIKFNNWLIYNGANKKVASDIVSRLKRIDKELLYSDLNTTVDEQYKIDACKSIIYSLNKKNIDDKNILISTNLPIKKAEISNYKTALKKYLKYLES